jgi:hypothetical protein
LEPGNGILALRTSWSVSASSDRNTSPLGDPWPRFGNDPWQGQEEWHRDVTQLGVVLSGSTATNDARSRCHPALLQYSQVIPSNLLQAEILLRSTQVSINVRSKYFLNIIEC